MLEFRLSAKAQEFLAMAGREGVLRVPQYFNHFNRPCGPCQEEIELLEKGYLTVGERTVSHVEYQLTEKAQRYLATQRQALR